MSWPFNSLKIIYSLGPSCYKTGKGFWTTKNIKSVCTKKVDLWKLGIILPCLYFRHTGTFNRLQTTIFSSGPPKLQPFYTCLSTPLLPSPRKVNLVTGTSILLYMTSATWNVNMKRIEISYLTLILNVCRQNISSLLIAYITWCLNM